MHQYVRKLKTRFTIQNLASFDNPNPNQLTVDDVPVTQEVAALANALRAKMPWVKFGVDQHDKQTNELHGETNVRFRYLYVYREGDLFAMGAIGYDYLKDIGNAQSSYFVVGEKIRNNAYKWGIRVNMRMSGKMETVVKHALGNLIGLGVEEAVDDSLSLFFNNYIRNRDESVAEYGKVLSQFSDMFSVYSQFSGTVDKSKLSGIENLRVAVETDFWQEDLKNTIIKASDAANSVIKLTDAPINIYCVMVTQNPWQEVICSVKPIWVGKAIRSRYVSDLDLSDEETKVYGENELPENLMQALGVLNMAKVNQFVDGAGMKINSQLFYVIEEVTNEKLEMVNP